MEVTLGRGIFEDSLFTEQSLTWDGLLFILQIYEILITYNYKIKLLSNLKFSTYK